MHLPNETLIKNFQVSIVVVSIQKKTYWTIYSWYLNTHIHKHTQMASNKRKFQKEWIQCPNKLISSFYKIEIIMCWYGLYFSLWYFNVHLEVLTSEYKIALQPPKLISVKKGKRHAVGWLRLNNLQPL